MISLLVTFGFLGAGGPEVDQERIDVGLLAVSGTTQQRLEVEARHGRSKDQRSDELEHAQKMIPTKGAQTLTRGLRWW